MRCLINKNGGIQIVNELGDINIKCRNIKIESEKEIYVGSKRTVKAESEDEVSESNDNAENPNQNVAGSQDDYLSNPSLSAEEQKQKEEQLRADLDADYFRWRDEKEEANSKETKDLAEGLQKMWKNLTGSGK